MCTDDPKTIEMAKLLAVDLRGVNSARGKASPGLEGLQSFKKRTKVVFDEQFKMEKIFYGPASLRLAGDIMRKQEAEYRQFQFDIASEAILLSQRIIVDTLRSIHEEGCEDCFNELLEEVVPPFCDLTEDEFIDNRVSGRAHLGFGFREQYNSSYFVISSITNSVRTEYEVIKEKYIHPITTRVCNEILDMPLWKAYPHRVEAPDRRWGWTICEPKQASKGKACEIVEIFTTAPGQDHRLKIYTKL